MSTVYFVRCQMIDSTGKMLAAEILPIRYDDNYITIFPRETRTIESVYETSLLSGRQPLLEYEGYDVAKQGAPLPESKKN